MSSHEMALAVLSWSVPPINGWGVIVLANDWSNFSNCLNQMAQGVVPINLSGHDENLTVKFISWLTLM